MGEGRIAVANATHLLPEKDMHDWGRRSECVRSKLIIRGGRRSAPREPLSARDSLPTGVPAIFHWGALAVTTALTLAFVIAADLQIAGALIPLGLFVLFFAPGYGAVAILFGNRTVPSLAINVAMIVAFSVVINVVLGTLLFYFGVGPLTVLVGLGDAAVCWAGTAVQYRRPSTPGAGGWARRFRFLYELPGFTSRQRAAAYALFACILLTFGVIGYLSTVPSGPTTDLSLGVLGPDGTARTLPTAGIVNGSLTVEVVVQNGATAQSLDLTVNATLVGENATQMTSVPWDMPLQLAPNATSSTVLHLPSKGSDSMDVSFEFSSGGSYVVSFSLAPPQTHVVLRESAISLQIV